MLICFGAVVGIPKYTSLGRLVWILAICLAFWSCVSLLYRRLDSNRHNGSGISVISPVTTFCHCVASHSFEYVALAIGPAIGVLASSVPTSVSWWPSIVVVVLTKIMTSGWRAKLDAVLWKSPSSTIRAFVEVAKRITSTSLP